MVCSIRFVSSHIFSVEFNFEYIITVSDMEILNICASYSNIKSCHVSVSVNVCLLSNFGRFRGYSSISLQVVSEFGSQLSKERLLIILIKSLGGSSLLGSETVCISGLVVSLCSSEG